MMATICNIGLHGGRLHIEHPEAGRGIGAHANHRRSRRAAHASSVGPIDESQLFYLESRGIPPDEARKFIVLGFLEPVVARVTLASAQDTLRELLEAKWDAGAAAAVAARSTAAPAA